MLIPLNMKGFDSCFFAFPPIYPAGKKNLLDDEYVQQFG